MNRRRHVAAALIAREHNNWRRRQHRYLFGRLISLINGGCVSEKLLAEKL